MLFVAIDIVVLLTALCDFQESGNFQYYAAAIFLSNLFNLKDYALVEDSCPSC